MNAPVALFTYKRPFHTKATLDALSANKLANKTDLFIFSDGPKSSSDHDSINDVRRILYKISGFASVRIIERSTNMGLANSIIVGVSEIFSLHEKIIVLEDDLETSPYFLNYMNGALDHYKTDSRVFSVTGYTFPEKYMKIPETYHYDTFVGFRCASWSWGTWRDRWSKIAWDMSYFDSFINDKNEQDLFNKSGQDMTQLLTLQYQKKIDSWAIRFCYAHHKNKMWCIYPVKSLVKNIGLDYSGTHTGPEPRYTHKSLDQDWQPLSFCPTASDDSRITERFRSIFDPPQKSTYRKAFEYSKRIIKKSLRIFQKTHKKLKNIFFPTIEQVDILVVNSFQKNGGAARAAYRTFLGVKNHYKTVKYLNLLKDDSAPDVIGPSGLRGILVKVLTRLDRIPLSFYPNRLSSTFSPSFWANPMRIPLARFESKLVHFHWVGAGMLRIEELTKIKSPIVWTLHDMWGFTGGCHYSGICEGFKTGCGCCPHLGRKKVNDISKSLIKRKLKTFKDINITIVSPSRWLAEKARSSMLFKDLRIEVIPNGLDTEVFKPIDQVTAKKYLNLPLDEPVLLFGAQSLLDPRKGGDLLFELLKKINFSCTLLLFGEGSLPLGGFPEIKVRSLGVLSDDISLALVYSASDVFLCLSREDNLPNTVAESLSCGTPCVAFDINGLPDMIETKKNGWLAPPFNTDDILVGIRYLAFHPDKEELRMNARMHAVSEYSMQRMADRYLALYSDLL